MSSPRPAVHGCYVWGKTVHKEIGVHRYTRLAPDEWYIIENDHEAIISQELFDRVQARLGSYRQTAKHIKKLNPLSRKVYCGICGRAIVRRGKINIYYRCDTPKFMPNKGCSPDKVSIDDLQEAIVTAIRVQARYAVEIQHILDMRRKQERKCLDDVQKELQNLSLIKRKVTEQGQRYYESYVNGQLSREAYTTQKAALTERQEEIAQKTEQLQVQIAVAKAEAYRCVEHYSKYSELDQLTSEVAAELLDRVTIYPGERLDIRLNYADELESLYSRLIT